MTTLNDLHDRLTMTVPEAGELLGIGRRSAYRAVERGEIPAIRIGARILVPTAQLLELLGAPSGVIPADDQETSSV